MKVPWSLKSPVKTAATKTPKPLRLPQVVFYQSVLSVFPWTLSWLESRRRGSSQGDAVTSCYRHPVLQKHAFVLHVGTVGNSVAFPGTLQNYLWFQPLLKAVAKCQSSLSKTRDSKAIVLQPDSPSFGLMKCFFSYGELDSNVSDIHY